MIETPTVVDLESRPTAVIHFRIKFAEMADAFSTGVPEVLAVLAAQGSEPVSGAFARHFEMPPDGFDFDLGFIVTKPITASGRVKPSEWPAMTVARATYPGSYDGLPGAWGEFQAWIEAQNFASTAPGIWEHYVKNMDETSNPAELRTELNREVQR